MSKEQEKSELETDEARRLEDSATQTRFTWAVIFVALVTALVGLLTMIEPYTSTDNPLFNVTISIIYFVLTIGMSYTFYAMCRTSFIIDKLINEYETKAVQDFLKKYWNVPYAGLFRVKKENDIIEFKTKTVIFLCILVIVASVLPLLFKLGLM